jgi:adenosyl cobinamide kinase/adenosyl cobinamide phosphate guanylyltransferase
MSKLEKGTREKTLDDIEFQLKKLNQNICDLNQTLILLTTEIGKSKTPTE